MKTPVLLVLALLCTRPLTAQSCADNAPAARDVTARFTDATLSEDAETSQRLLSLKLSISPALDFRLGGLSLFFTYNDDALDFRRVVFSDFTTGNACYATLDNNRDESDGGQTAIGLVINPFTCAPTSGTDGTRLEPEGGPVVIATVEYAVVDASAEAAFIFTNTVSNDDTGQSCRTVGEPFVAQALPVELVSFTAHADGAGVALAWTTASETNSAFFAVEERDAEAWRETVRVTGAGTTLEAQHYTATVAGLAPGRHVFRLRQVDFDGTATLSAEVEVEIAPVEATLSVWPTPASGSTRVRFALPVAGHARVEVFDALGRAVARLFDGAFAAGAHEGTLETSALAPGLYVCRLTTDSGTMHRTLTVAR